MALASHQQVGGAGATEVAAGTQQQSFIRTVGLRFSAHLNRLPVGKGFAMAQLAVGVASLMATDPRADRGKAGLVGAEGEPEPVLLGLWRRGGDLNPPGLAPSRLQFKRSAPSLACSPERLIASLIRGSRLSAEGGGAMPSTSAPVHQRARWGPRSWG